MAGMSGAWKATMESMMRCVLALALLSSVPAARAADARDLPACEARPGPGEDWSRASENGFRFALPPGAQAQPRGASLDHEFGRWTWPDGRQLQFQYGFAVTELASWLELPFVTGCRGDLDGVEAVFLERREPDGSFAWAIGLFDYVQSYTPNGDALGDDNASLANDLALIGAGPAEAVLAQGRAVFDSFRWSRLPDSSLAAWSVDGASNNGVLVFETARGAAGLMLATYRDGVPYWLVGQTPGAVMSYRLAKVPFEDGEASAVALPFTLYETRDGESPGQPDRPAQVPAHADAGMVASLSQDCERA